MKIRKRFLLVLSFLVVVVVSQMWIFINNSRDDSVIDSLSLMIQHDHPVEFKINLNMTDDQQNQKLIGENQEAKNSERNFDEIHPKNMRKIDRKYSDLNNHDKKNDDLVDVQNYEAIPKKNDGTVDQENEEINDQYGNQDVIVRDNQDVIVRDNQDVIVRDKQDVNNQDVIVRDNQDVIVRDKQDAIVRDNQDAIVRDNQDVIVRDYQETIDKKYKEKVVQKNNKIINRTDHESTDQQNHELVIQENHGPIDQEKRVSFEKENLEVFTVKNSDVDADPKNPKRLAHKNDEADLKEISQQEDEFFHVYQKSNITNQQTYHESDALKVEKRKPEINGIQSNESGIQGTSMDHKRNKNSFTKSTVSVQANEEKSVDDVAHFKMFTLQRTVVNMKEHKSVPQYTMSPLRNDVDKDDFAAKDFNGDLESRVKKTDLINVKKRSTEDKVTDRGSSFVDGLQDKRKQISTVTAKIRKLRNQINFTSDLNSDDNSILSRKHTKQFTNKQAKLNLKAGGENLNPRSTVVKPVLSNDMDKDAFAGDVESHDLDRDTLPMKRRVVSSSNGTRNSMLETETGINVVSMSLYGADRRYTTGAIRNAELIQTNFPGWRLRIYMESPLTASRFGAVPNNVIESLRSLGADVHYIVPEEDFLPPMMWRFLVADDLSIDRFIVRDSDSRLTERDAAAVNAWVKSDKPFHCIRDHPSHAGYSISGGLWGGMTRELRNILRRSWIDLMRGLPSGYFSDMSFLQDIIWPKVKNYAYCSDSVSCDRWPNAHPFPVPRYGYDHVGQVYNEHDLGRPIDFRILRAAGENRKCLSEES